MVAGENPKTQTTVIKLKVDPHFFFVGGGGWWWWMVVVDGGGGGGGGVVMADSLVQYQSRCTSLLPSITSLAHWPPTSIHDRCICAA